MAAPDTKIRAALTTRLEAFPDLPDVAWENVAYTPADGVTYLEPFLLPAETFQAEIGTLGANRHTGVYQISIKAPKGNGTATVNALRDALVDHFVRGTELTYSDIVVKVEKAYASAMITESTRVHIPITIRYRTDAAN